MPIIGAPRFDTQGRELHQEEAARRSCLKPCHSTAHYPRWATTAEGRYGNCKRESRSDGRRSKSILRLFRLALFARACGEIIICRRNRGCGNEKVRNTVAQLALAHRTLQSKPQKPNLRFLTFFFLPHSVSGGWIGSTSCRKVIGGLSQAPRLLKPRVRVSPCEPTPPPEKPMP